MRKLLFLVLVITMFLLVSCGGSDKKGENSVDNSAKNEESVESVNKAEDQEYDDSSDYSGKLTLYECSYKGKEPGIEKIIEFDSKTGLEIKKSLDKMEWENEAQIDRAYAIWFDFELQFNGCEDIYKFGFGDRTAIHRIPDAGTFSAGTPDEVYALCPGRTEGWNFDDNGLLTEEDSIKYAKKCLLSYITNRKNSEEGDFSTSDDWDSYVVMTRPADQTEIINVMIEKPGEKNYYCFLDVNRKRVGIISDFHRSWEYEKLAIPEKLSYEGLEIKFDYARAYINAGIYSDGHYSYYIDDVNGNLNGIRYIDEYRPQPVEDILADAKAYFSRLYPDFITNDEGWNQEDALRRDGSRTVSYTKKVNGKPETIASFLYDGENRLLIAYTTLYLTKLIKEDDLQVLEAVKKYLEEYIEKEKAEGISFNADNLEDYQVNINSYPEKNVWYVMFSLYEPKDDSLPETYLCELSYVDGEPQVKLLEKK